MLIEKSLQSYLDEVDSSLAAPGGGSVCGFCGALAVALIRMYAHLSIQKKGFLALDEDKQYLFLKRFSSLEVKKRELLKIVDTDKEAYEGWLHAYREVKKADTEENRRLLKEAGDQAIRVPYQCMEFSLDAMKLAYDMVAYGNRLAISDLMIGVIYLEATLRASIYNVRANLLQEEEQMVMHWNALIEQLEQESARVFAQIETAVERRFA